MFLVVSDDPSKNSVNYSIDPVKFAEQMRLRWPTCEIRKASAESIALLYWSLYSEDDTGMPANGTLFEYFTSFRPGNRGQTSEFVHWFRDIIPDSIPILCSFDVYGTDFDVHPQITIDEISEQFANLWEWYD